ncbi:MAG: CopD family protein [Pyrobaculum sp.]
MPWVYPVLVLVHVLAAIVWVGAHVMLVVGPLRDAVRANDPGPILEFEKRYERLAMVSLIVAAATGITMALQRYPAADWLLLAQPSGRVGLKVATFLAVLALAIHARLAVIPALRRGDNGAVKSMAAHVAAVTLLSLVFVALGVLLRFGL